MEWNLDFRGNDKLTDELEDALKPAIRRLDKDVKEAAKLMTPKQARYLVDLYYNQQEERKREANQQRALDKSEEPSRVIAWLAEQSETLESRIKTLLDIYSASQEIGIWARSVCGIGPVISSGLMAHIDIEKAPTVGHIWRFAGLDPTVKWLGAEGAAELVKAQWHSDEEPANNLRSMAVTIGRNPDGLLGMAEKFGEGKITKTSVTKALAMRPWNAALKTLCWKIGESFVKVSGRDDAYYGHVYVERKALEMKRNEEFAFVEQAKQILETKRIGKETEAYKAYSIGKLPQAHIHARACRYAVKLFLSHYHGQAYRLHYGKEPPLPYPIAILGHAHLK